MKHLVALSVALILATRAAPAQDVVGHLPTQSPYRDLEFRQEASLVAGWFAASRDEAGVAPQSAPIVGARYELKIGGPAMLVVRAGTAFSERTVIDPRQAEGSRTLGTESWPIYLMDVGLALNLTGQKSWHSLVPVVQGSIGAVTDFRSRPDVGGWSFGTPFAVSVGAGVRWVPGGRFQMRLDVSDNLYTISYPSTYFIPPTTGGPAVLPPGASRKSWKHNGSFTLGASYLFFR